MSSYRLSTNLQAILWVTASVGLFSLVFASGRFAVGEASAVQILFIRYLGGLMTLAGVVYFQKRPLSFFKSQQVREHGLRAFCGSMGGVCAIYAATHMPMVDAAAIGLLDTVLLILLGIWWLHESITVRKSLAMVLCFMGAAIILISKGALEGGDRSYLFPGMIAFFSAILIAVEGILIKRLSVSEHPLTVLLYVNTFGALLMFIPAIIFWQGNFSVESTVFLLLGPVAILAQYFTIRGYQLADVSVVGPVNYTWLIFAALIGWYFFAEALSVETLVGSALIVLGGVLLAKPD